MGLKARDYAETTKSLHGAIKLSATSAPPDPPLHVRLARVSRHVEFPEGRLFLSSTAL